MTKHNYLTNMANAIVDDETGKELNYRQLSKHPKYQKIWKKYFSNKLGRLSQGAEGKVEGTYIMLFVSQDQVPIYQLKDV